MSIRPKILVAATGSVASIKLPQLCEELQNLNYEVKVVVTEPAFHFFEESEIPTGIQVVEDRDEWKSWSKRGDPVLHIELTKWADVLLFAPLDANSLGKMASGICDNLVTCCARAWDVKKPLIFCPAMNTKMYEHPITSQQISILEQWGYLQVPVVAKTLICGDTGLGAMAEISTILAKVKDVVGKL